MKINEKRQKRLRRLAAAAFVAAFLLGGCAPGIQMQVERAPNWNTAGVKRVAVMPFEHGRGREEAEAARFLTNDAMTRVRQTNRFTLISDAEVSRLRLSGEDISNHVDALFTGKILSIESRDSSYVGQRYDSEAKRNVDIVVYTREVELTLTYSLELARDGSLVGISTKTGRASDMQYSSHSLKQPSRMLQECNVLRGIGRDIAPYTVSETRFLMNEKTKDKELKEKMRAALAHVQQGSYRSALAAYLKIYDDYGTLAAIYNAAIMQEGLGDLQAAIGLMERAASETGNPAANREIARLNARVREQETVDNEYKAPGPGRLIDKVIAHASGEAIRVLPPNARVWLVDKEDGDRNLTAAVADGIISALIRSGVIVVDRENAALITRELLLQMSGSVSDSDLLRAGNQAGANTIITIAVTGTGSMRRLQLRILDVEKGVPLLQSDTGEKWNL